ncbi:hypothetical protein TNCV_4271051 [Trichonephila clavipes]|nr:hypothetical protein TNCV_4271051 [Trichonephila clavipes]
MKEEYCRGFLIGKEPGRTLKTSWYASNNKKKCLIVSIGVRQKQDRCLSMEEISVISIFKMIETNHCHENRESRSWSALQIRTATSRTINQDFNIFASFPVFAHMILRHLQWNELSPRQLSLDNMQLRERW